MAQNDTTIAWYEDLGRLFGFDHLEINRIDESTLEIKASISSEKTVLNYYKIFLAFINEIEKAKNDPKALSVFKKNLTEYKYAFDTHMESVCEEIEKAFNKFKVDITLSYEGEFKTVYSKVSQLVI